ncbi:16S rRNA (uracil(1498)-N(3))-methyltransferase [Ramlibacter henchirensis]|uniref:Ribosomal RNA small subunit methyltransferase E n=1 Tax=Ramlibacter henchirensis TaxID=204072 RepID=A0A4Z0C8S5_9BURK|nr:16S rRNA (uracil(1498)-N(3))-methyltransferase [Ramlibacter henchirensis]TFZ06798.1 16S rRNA (uracil(1498)-N(3))-methyltransferase [Ramlibacter henchirensis]
MPPRLHCPVPLQEGALLELPSTAARHVQVLRLQPGDPVTLFDGRAGEWDASVERMGRSEVLVRVGSHRAIDREPAVQVHLAIGIPANERMDWLVEKAAELGAASIQPLATERTVLRLQGERALKKQAHWQAIAAAACEQCGGNRVPVVHAIADLASWTPPAGLLRRVLSFDVAARPLQGTRADAPVLLLSGPEGGLSPREEDRARAEGFEPVTLGPRVLRAETAPLAALAALTLASAPEVPAP